MPASLLLLLTVLLGAPLSARADDLMLLLQSGSCPNCKLADSDLVHADLRDADLKGAHLQRSNLSQARLDGADLSGSDLRFTSLQGASLRGTDLRMLTLRDLQARSEIEPRSCRDRAEIVTCSSTRRLLLVACSL